jgi:hypothetical protein
MNTPLELCRPILANPWSDLPRSEFARGIEAVDPARAQFIRLGLRLAAARRKRYGYDDITTIEAEIRAAVPFARAAQWRLPVEEIAGKACCATFGRGFVERVNIDAALFLARAPELFASAPIIDLVLTNLPAVAVDFFASPHLAQIRSLDFIGASVSDDVLEHVCRCPYLGRLQCLNLYAQPITHGGIEQLAASNCLAKLAWVGGGGSAVVNGVRCNTPSVNPTPKEDEGGVYGFTANAWAQELSDRFGGRLWLQNSWTSDAIPHPEAFSSSNDR